MAGDWIKIENTLPDKPEVWQIAEALKIDADAVTGKLLRIWAWASENCYADGVTDVTVIPLLNRITGVNGFVEAMKKTGWLIEENGNLIFKNFDRHCSKSAKERALTLLRMKKNRALCNGNVTEELRQERNKNNDKSVTDASPEKERELKENIKEKTPTLFIIPEKLDTPEFRAAWEKWEAHCIENNKPVKPTQRDVTLMKLAREGSAEDAIAAIENSITKKKTVIFPPWPEAKPSEGDSVPGDGLDEIAAQKAARDKAFAEACAR